MLLYSRSRDKVLRVVTFQRKIRDCSQSIGLSGCGDPAMYMYVIIIFLFLFAFLRGAKLNKYKYKYYLRPDTSLHGHLPVERFVCFLLQ